MKKVFIAVVLTTILVAMLAMFVWGACESYEVSQKKSPIELAKYDIAKNEQYEGKEIMWIVTPVEDETLEKGEYYYIIIALTEEDELVMDYYGVYIRERQDGSIYVDADLFKTEVFE